MWFRRVVEDWGDEAMDIKCVVVETYFDGRYGEKFGINVGFKVGIGVIFSVDLREFVGFGVVLQLSDNLLVVLVEGYFVSASK